MPFGANQDDLHGKIMENFSRFIEVVKKYAEAYKDFEELQKTPDFDFIRHSGDQKTGIIGEAFIFEYLKKKGHSDLTFANNSQFGWGIIQPHKLSSNQDIFIQVKTVSVFSKAKTISNIHIVPNCFELYLVSLNKDLIPDNIWKPKGFNPVKLKVRDGEEVVTGRMPKNTNDTASGFTGLENIFGDFKATFPELYPPSARKVSFLS
jgi:hypothetical protein